MVFCKKFLLFLDYPNFFFGSEGGFWSNWRPATRHFPILNFVVYVTTSSSQRINHIKFFVIVHRDAHKKTVKKAFKDSD